MRSRMIINFKQGGINHALIPKVAINKRTMIVGADVTHSGQGRDPGCPSLAGIVASFGPNMTTYLASARLQTNNTEVSISCQFLTIILAYHEFVDDLRGMMAERLVAYYDKQSVFPAHILFHRDGVNKSQYGMVKDEEIPQIYAACKEASTKKKRPCAPKLTVIVVGKRHHARFFESHDSEYNLSPGLCIYYTVTAPNQFSFYLQSRHSQLRIARSGHYVVIENESRYKPKNLQLIVSLIYQNCHSG